MMWKAAIVGIALGTMSGAAQADEVWVCKFPETPSNPSSTRYSLHEKTLSEIDGVNYSVLIDNDVAIVAVLGEGMGPTYPGPQVPHDPIIQTNTVAIYRKTGAAVRGFVALYGPGKAPVHGTCHRQTSQSAP